MSFQRNSTSDEPFASDSGSEYLPTSNRQKREHYDFSIDKMIGETNATTNASDNVKNEIVAVCEGGQCKIVVLVAMLAERNPVIFLKVI